MEVLVDDEDYMELMQWKWTAANCPTNLSYYAQRHSNTTIKMHRQIMSCPKGLQVDHINGDTLDNRKINLRIVQPGQNARNRKHQFSATFKYKGVGTNPRSKIRPYKARITINGTTLSLGTFKTIIDAAKAYNIAALEHHGEFAHLNIIKD